MKIFFFFLNMVLDVANIGAHHSKSWSKQTTKPITRRLLLTAQCKSHVTSLGEVVEALLTSEVIEKALDQLVGVGGNVSSFAESI